MTDAPAPITVIGAGITGLWQAWTLQSRGHAVELLDRSPADAPFAHAASWYAAGMLAPDCESEAAEPVVRELGVRAMALWRAFDPSIAFEGSLVLARARDRAELTRFARLTTGHEQIDTAHITDLEPDLEGRFARGLFFAREGHMPTRTALARLLDAFRRGGGTTRFGVDGDAAANEARAAGRRTIDCRGLGARTALANRQLRGVRGEMAVVETRDITLNRPIRLLHPRFPLYVVPWGEGRYMIGSTVIESEDTSAVTARSALEILGTAYALHPAFGEARVLELGSGVRPAFPDNVPKIVISEQRIYVNGMYRHGFLTAPALAEIVADYLATGAAQSEVVIADRRER